MGAERNRRCYPADIVTAPKSRRNVGSAEKPAPGEPPGPPALTVQPIGYVRSPFLDRVSTPRQPAAARGVVGTIELLPGHDFEHALADLDAWDHSWVLFWFHLNEGWRPKVLPPRSTKRRGVFSTRAPHRPNPIGLSVLALEAVQGLTLHVRDIDLIDGTPILDIKPYVPFTDVIPSANTGWLETPDPGPKFDVVWSPLAASQAAFLRESFDVDLATPVSQILALGYEPHPYRRIRKREQGYRLAVKDWRADFAVEATTIHVTSIVSGYRSSQLENAADPTLAPHRAFADRFGKRDVAE
jgi:tRNA-Thr(GGU) m(6)t(6)A37 methyltransferase TsaA